MKKLLAIILASVIFMSLCACGKKSDTETKTDETSKTQAEYQTEVTAEIPVEESSTENTTEAPTEHTHSWKNATCSAPKTCKTCGATEGEPNEHKWEDATCTSPKKCSVCGETEGSAGKHNPTSNGTCSICGSNIAAEEYSYLAGTDFRRVRREYSQAVANGAYVVPYTSSTGDSCVITYVSYKIVNNYSVTTLHNLTTGETIEEPFDYYNTLASRGYGQSKMYYMDLANEAREKELVAMRGLSDVLSSGSHSGAGAYVSSEILNL